MTLRDAVLPPADAPFVPGDGPRYRSASRAREREWLRWWWASAGLGALGVVGLVLGLTAPSDTPGLLLWFGCWMAAILCMVPAHRRGWSQRHDRYDDEVRRYAGGVRTELSLLPDEGAVRLGGRTVARSTRRSAPGRRVVELDARAFTLEERPAARDDDGTVRAVEVRLVDQDGVVAASASGARLGDLVDWTLDLPLGTLRLRQRLHAVPSRRTLLDGWGRAWRVLADADRWLWTVELPVEAGPLDAVFVTWFVCHLDAVGMECAYLPAHEGFGPARTATDVDPARRLPEGGFTRTDDDAWMPVGDPAERPAIPTAGGVEIY